MFGFTELDAALSSVARRTSLLQGAERRPESRERVYHILVLPHTTRNSLSGHIGMSCQLHKMILKETNVIHLNIKKEYHKFAKEANIYSIIPYRRTLLGKLMVTQRIKKFPVF
jgi:hypothetical protein